MGTPLVNGIKGTLVLGLSVIAMADALRAMLTGGREIDAALAVTYGIFASIVCWIVASITHRGAKETRSPLVRADAENWIVNAAISSCVLLAFAGIFVLRAFGLDELTPYLDPAELTPYLDPAVVFVIVLVFIGVPVRMAWNALMALLNRAPDEEIVERVTVVVDECLADMPVNERFVRVIQPGRHRMVLVHVVLEREYWPDGVDELDAIREPTYQALSKEHGGVLLDILFTGDRKWGAPLSDGGSGGLDQGKS